MTQQEINHAVADVTGESIGLIEDRGFCLADPLEPVYDPEPRAPLTIDWDTYSPIEWPGC